jgi:hypothetical protein
MLERNKKCIQFYFKNLKGRNHLEDLSIDARRILKKLSVGVQTGPE